MFRWLSIFIFHSSNEGGNEDSENSDPFFANIGLSLVKTIVMFVGEMDYTDLKFSHWLGYLIFSLFIYFLIIVLMNILNGLAVSDIGRWCIFHQKCDRKVFTFMISHVNWNFGDYYVSLKITRGSGQFLSHFYRWNIVSYEQCKNVSGWNRHLSKHKATKYHLIWNWCSWDKGITNIAPLRLSISFRIEFK